MQLNLLVLRCKNIEVTKNFYEKLGFEFLQEQHGKGPIHYSANINEIVIELYPLNDKKSIDNIRLGFSLDDKDVSNYLKSIGIESISNYEFQGKKNFVVIDPDGRKLELRN